ncbi:hypothetical protein LTR37_013207 [Vermiconidia calcicola]|uniref:Uncharacterized protein n=1 Tax=Vermiconidia calcicola TaxID=1690605 RepID=A0ACC3MXN2_9PEZI|nr:hypothetical protein LTR37_013207 [Vermiconidia calcicola]
MSKAVNSPTARLLQSSRLFSLPRPLPQPLNESLTSTGVYRASDTATLPYPTHQAITTPASSLHRGDFGLKRALPAKTTRRTSTPHIRVQAQDTFEHITDFSSAADHTRTEAKWAAMGVPMVQRPLKRGSARQPVGVSVYESYLDNTDPEARAVEEVAGRRGGSTQAARRLAAGSRSEPKAMQRWKYEGPWIAGMQEGEFNQYLQRNIESKKDEWREFLRNREADARLRDIQRDAREQGESLSISIPQLRTQLRPTDAQLTQLEKRLRDDHTTEGLSSRLTALLADFLDLPGVYNSGTDNPSLQTRTELGTALTKHLGTGSNADDGPPTTHPAAGLSHLRTNAGMYNHPLYGPQAEPSPIQARVVRPRTSASGADDYEAKLGVGGFVALDPITGTHEQRHGAARRGGRGDEAVDAAERLDLDALGGNKVWVRPRNAYVDERGRVRLSVARAGGEALAVKLGGEELERIQDAKRAGRTPPALSSGFSAAPVGMGQGRGPSGVPFGLEQPQTGSGGRSRVEGFDELLARGRGGQGRESNAAGRMRELLERR